jgi:phosphate transport system substrate-binding protein
VRDKIAVVSFFSRPGRWFPILWLGGLVLVTGACGRGAAGRGVIVAGSTSIQPFADRWAEIYMAENPGRVVNVQGGGSSAGIQAALSGAADIGMSSRELKPEEKSLTETVIAHDGLAVIVHPSNTVSDLSLVEVQNIFNGDIKSWALLGGVDAPITVVTREEGSGTRGAFQELVMKKDRIWNRAVVEDSNGTVREIVANDPHSIGFISLGLVEARVKAVYLDGVEPTRDNIDSKLYRLVRPFLFVTNGPPKPAARDFIDFVISPQGQRLVAGEGLIPLGR